MELLISSNFRKEVEIARKCTRVCSSFVTYLGEFHHFRRRVACSDLTMPQIFNNRNGSTGQPDLRCRKWKKYQTYTYLSHVHSSCDCCLRGRGDKVGAFRREVVACLNVRNKVYKIHNVGGYEPITSWICSTPAPLLPYESSNLKRGYDFKQLYPEKAEQYSQKVKKLGAQTHAVSSICKKELKLVVHPWNEALT